jgi:transcription elongation factor Elf1
MAKIYDMTPEIPHEECPVCGSRKVLITTDRPGTWDGSKSIIAIECAECGLPLWVVDEDD